eukprot:jgi/Astpho2/7323/Aster-01624
MQVVNDRPFCGRETEQAHLLAQLKQTPDNMLLLLGPRSSGKSRFLKEVLLSDRLDTPVSFFNGRVELSHACVLVERLWVELKAQLNALDEPEQAMPPRRGSVDVSLPPLASTTSNMSAAITAFGAFLTVRKEASLSPPVICIDHADVLMDWYEGDSTMQTDIKPLLNFFVQGLMSNKGEVSDKEWASVFEVCGGNPGALTTTSRLWKTLGDVQADDLYSTLNMSGKSAEAAVQAMAKANMLAFRPASEWAMDIPMGAVGPAQQDVVTAPSATHLYGMRHLWERYKAYWIRAPRAAPGPSQTKQQIKNMKEKICAVESQTTEPCITKLDGWQDESAYLW